MFSFFTENLIWTEGIVVFGIAAAVIALGLLIWRPIAYLGAAFLIFSFFFFRNPHRTPAVSTPATIVCPADGTVVDIQHDPTGESLGGYQQKVSIFLSVFDAHVNWMPYAGTVERIVYTPGAFVFAFLPKSSELNEHNDVVVRTERGDTFMVRQIAGTVARRICCWINEQDSVATGQKYGMIRFGSRVDIFLPAHVRLEIAMGDTVYGGQTVLGTWLWH